jgi:hypothetical protein
VNANPRCAALSLPCTHDEESDWGGYGLDASVGVNISRRLAVVGAFSTWAGRWDSVESIEAHRPEINRVRAWLGGFRLSPGFSRPNPRTLESNRPFVQILVGPERSTLFGVRPVAQLSAGLDMHGPFASRVRPGKPMTLRMDLGYRVALSGGERATGLHFFIGAVLGPRLGEG